MCAGASITVTFASLSALISDTPHAPPCRRIRGGSAPYAPPSVEIATGFGFTASFICRDKIPFVHFPVTEHAPFTLLGEAEQFTVGNDGYNYAIPFFIVSCLINPFCNLDIRFLGDLSVTQPVCQRLLYLSLSLGLPPHVLSTPDVSLSNSTIVSV